MYVPGAIILWHLSLKLLTHRSQHLQLRREGAEVRHILRCLLPLRQHLLALLELDPQLRLELPPLPHCIVQQLLHLPQLGLTSSLELLLLSLTLCRSRRLRRLHPRRVCA